MIIFNYLVNCLALIKIELYRKFYAESTDGINLTIGAVVLKILLVFVWVFF